MNPKESPKKKFQKISKNPEEKDTIVNKSRVWAEINDRPRVISMGILRRPADDDDWRREMSKAKTEKKKVLNDQ